MYKSYINELIVFIYYIIEAVADIAIDNTDIWIYILITGVFFVQKAKFIHEKFKFYTKITHKKGGRTKNVVKVTCSSMKNRIKLYKYNKNREKKIFFLIKKCI